MRILIIDYHREYRCWHRAGAFAKSLVERGHKVTLMVTSDTARFHFSQRVVDGIRIVTCPDLLSGKARSGWDPVSVWRRINWLKSDQRDYDVVHIMETRPTTIFPGLFMKRARGIPLVIDWIDWWGRGGIIKVLRPWWYRALFGAIETFFEEHYRKFADATTVISRGLARRAASLGVRPETITHLLPGIHHARFGDTGREEVRKRLGYKLDQIVVGYSSQDTFFDIDAALDGVKIARMEGCNVRLMIVGNHDRHLERHVRERGLMSITHLAGFVSAEDYPKYLAAADLFVLPFPHSVHNLGRWPNKMGDYMACGRPIVFNPEGELAPFAHEPPGIVCAYSAIAFGEAIVALAKSSALRLALGMRAQRIARERFNWQVQTRILERVYKLEHPQTEAVPIGPSSPDRTQRSLLGSALMELDSIGANR